MRRAERVVLRLRAAREARDAAEHPQPIHRAPAAGEDLVRIALVPDVPHDPVGRGVEDVVQGDRELDRAQVRRQMAAGAGDGFEQERPQLVGKLAELAAIEAAEVGRVVDGLEERVHEGWCPFLGRGSRVG